MPTEQRALEHPSVVHLQVAPEAGFTDADETLSVLEDSGPSTGSLLAGTTSVDGPLSVQSFSIAGQAGPFLVGTAYVVAGQGALTIGADGSYSFTPVANWNGAFPVVSYVVTDGVSTDSSTLAIAVTPVTDGFTDNNETRTVAEDSGTSTGSLLAGTSSVDGPLGIQSFSIAGQAGPFVFGAATVVAGQGALTVSADGSYSFTPEANWNGVFPVISYVVTDGVSTDSSTLTITVTPVTDGFADADETLSVAEDSGPSTGNLLAGTTSVDGPVSIQGFSIAGQAGPFLLGTAYLVAGQGTLTVNTDGSYSFTPAANWNGSFPLLTYTVTDGVSTDDSTLAITVDAVADGFADADETLSVLEDSGPSTGNLLAGMRAARMHITDVLGKRADLRISDRVFGHALRVRNQARPRATGSFIAQIRELEPVREMLTSTTVAALVDVPFFLLFCGVFWAITGPLALVPLVAGVLLVLPSLLAQRRLRTLAQGGARESALRNAMLVEAVQGIEDIKLLQAEPRMQNQWNHGNAVNAEAGLRLRALLNTLNNWQQAVQGAAFAVVLFVGAPLVMAGQMSTGVLVAASILCSRVLAPLAGLTQVLSRWQQAKVAGEALDRLMQLPVDHAPDRTRVHRPALQGDYAIEQARFSHDGETAALQVKRLRIAAGERIAVLGRNGAGKSTLLQALSGLLAPSEGSVLLDGVALAHIDPADVRRDVALLTQNARLFHGTLRDNLQLGAPHASDDELIACLQAVGVWDTVRRLPTGLDHPVHEGGLGLSGGQRQSLLLARLLVRQPRVLLLDEPSAALDEVAEREVIAQLRTLAPGRTLIVATHRPAVLDAVDRVLVLEAGAIVLDGPRDSVLAKLRQGPASRATEVAP